MSPLPPVVLGAALIVPGGLIGRLSGKKENEGRIFAKETKRIEKIAMEAVMEAEKRLGYEPRDVSDQKCGYDIESHMTGTGRLRFIEVKGRVEGADTVTVTKNEILVALNKPEDFLLALVSVSQSEELRESGTSKVREAPATCKEQKYEIRYIWHPFHKEPDFDVSSVNYKWEELWAKGLAPKNL